MKKQDDLRKYYNRLVLESSVSSGMAGLGVGCCVSIVLTFIFWLVGYHNLWLELVVTFGAGAVAGVLFYFFKYRPNEYSVAKRIDNAGNEERIITMHELRNKGDNSLMALMQSSDAVSALSRTAVSAIGFSVSKLAAILMCPAMVCNAGMITVNELTARGIIPNGGTIIGNTFTPPEYFNVVFHVVDADGNEDVGGMIEDQDVFVLRKGESTDWVVAVADEGYMFQYWLDDENNTDPRRRETNIGDNMDIYAVFVRADENDEDGDGDNNDGDSDAGEEPPEPSAGQDPASDPDDPSPDDPSPGGTTTNSNDTIENGEIYYREKYDIYYEQAMKELEENGEISDELREILKAYFDALK